MSFQNICELRAHIIPIRMLKKKNSKKTYTANQTIRFLGLQFVPSIWTIATRSLDLNNSFYQIELSNSREQITIRENELFNSRERFAIRENGLSNSRERNLWERITNPWERITQFEKTIKIAMSDVFCINSTSWSFIQ